MTLLWLLAAGVMGNIAIWSGQKMASSVSFAMVMLGLSLGWVDPQDKYMAYEHGTKYHLPTCASMKEALAYGEKLRPYRSAEEAAGAGLVPHVCVTGGYLVTRRSTRTETTPQIYPPQNVKKYDTIAPTQPVSAVRPAELESPELDFAEMGGFIEGE